MKDVNIWDPVALRNAGLQALAETLGPIGMTLFLQQLQGGRGDYTKERQQWIDQWDLDTIVRQIHEMRERREREAAARTHEKGSESAE